jgi:PhnB protein
MSISAQLFVRHGRQAVAFYVAAFGAQVIYQVGGDDAHAEVVAELELGGTTFWVSDEAPAFGHSSSRTPGGTSVRLLLRTEDPAAVQARAVALGAQELAPVASGHGWLLGRVLDPFGHVWEIARPLGPWPPPAGAP